MATADLRVELSCSICLSIYTDPVSLPCGHNFCRGCIGMVLGTQKISGNYSCPECMKNFQKHPALHRNRTLGNISERFRPSLTETEPGETGIFCTYCVLSPVPAAKSCLRSFPSGRHYWEVEVSESGDWRVGVAYPNKERREHHTRIGNNNKSWCLCRCDNNYSVKHDKRDIDLPNIPSCRRIRIRLDYEAGRLSFYELSEPIRHLHTFTATFTEPLHAAFWVGWDDGTWVRIIN